MHVIVNTTNVLYKGGIMPGSNIPWVIVVEIIYCEYLDRRTPVNIYDIQRYEKMYFLTDEKGAKTQAINFVRRQKSMLRVGRKKERQKCLKKKEETVEDLPPVKDNGFRWL